MRRLKGSTAPTSLHYDHVVKASYKAQVSESEQYSLLNCKNQNKYLEPIVMSNKPTTEQA